jgi:hypothetical protein
MPPDSQYPVHNEVLARLGPLVYSTISHWALVNAALPPSHPLVLLTDLTLDGLRQLDAGLEPLRAQAGALRAGVGLLRGELRERQAHLREVGLFFNAVLRSSMPRARWLRLVQPVPQPGCDRYDALLGAVRVRVFWARLEAAPPPGWPGPPRLRDGTGLAEFAAEVLVLQAEVDLHVAEVAVEWTREQLAAAVLKYPAAVRSRLPAGHRWLASVPKPWPPGKRGGGR